MLNRIFNWLMLRASTGLPKREFPEDTHEPKDELPKRNEIQVVCEVRRFDPLAQVRKGWGSKLKLLLSQYICGDYNNRELWVPHALQTMLHEMMHIALWDDKSIVHSTDEKSILFAYIDGSNTEPTEWDLRVMKEAAERVDLITIDATKVKDREVFDILMDAVMYWNRWIGRGLFCLKVL